MARRALATFIALALLFGGCKKSTAKDDDLSSGRKAIAVGGGSTGKTSTKSHDEDDDVADDPSIAKRRLSSKEGSFRIDFPLGVTVPKGEDIPMNSAVGTLVLHNFMTETPVESFGTAYSDYPAGHVARSGGASFVLLNVQSGAVSAMYATLDHGEEVTHDGLLAREFTFTAQGATPPQHGRQFATLVGDRLYQVMFMSIDASALSSPRVNAFFASFHVTK